MLAAIDVRHSVERGQFHSNLEKFREINLQWKFAQKKYKYWFHEIFQL